MCKIFSKHQSSEVKFFLSRPVRVCLCVAVVVTMPLLSSLRFLIQLFNVISAGSESLQINNIDTSCFVGGVILQAVIMVFTVRRLSTVIRPLTGGYGL